MCHSIPFFIPSAWFASLMRAVRGIHGIMQIYVKYAVVKYCGIYNL